MVFPEAALEDLFATPIRNGIYKTKEFHGSGVPILNMGELFAAERIRCAPDNLIDVTDDELDRFGVEPGDLLFGRRSLVFEGSGKCSIVDLAAGERCVFESSLIRVRVDQGKADPDFLLAFFQSPQGRDRVLSIATQTAVSGIRGSDLALLPVPAPPVATQRQLGRALRALDDLIENNRRRIEVLEEMARLIYREWFVHFRFPGHEDVELVDSDLGPIPEGWQAGVFGDLVDVSREAANPDEIESGAALIGLEHLPRRSTTLQGWDVSDDVGSRKSFFAAGDILFGKIRPYFHKVALTPIGGYCSTDAIVFRPRPGVRGQALAVASSDEFVAHAVQTSNGTKMPRANTDVMMQYPVPIPTQDVREAFEAVLGPTTSLCVNLGAQMRTLTEARDLLLPRLISGELDVSDLDLDLDSVA